jgi:hypothetical protein
MGNSICLFSLREYMRIASSGEVTKLVKKKSCPGTLAYMIGILGYAYYIMIIFA